MHLNTYLKETCHNILQNEYCWVCPWLHNIDLSCISVDSYFFLFLFVIFIVDIQQLETHMKNRKQREQETRDSLISQLQQMIDSFQSSTDQLASNISANIRSEVQHQMQMMMAKYGKIFWLILMNYRVSGMWKKAVSYFCLTFPLFLYSLLVCHSCTENLKFSF